MFGLLLQRGALFALLMTSAAPALAQTQVECDDVDIQSYLLALIDVMYANGLTIWEDLIAHMSQSDKGYAYLESIYTADKVTLLVPTDAAMQTAGIWAPFGNQNETYLAHLAQLHTVHGFVTYDSLPAAPLKGVGSSFLSIKDYMSSDVNSTAHQAVGMMRNQQGATIRVLSASGAGTTWDGKLDLGNFPALDNIEILPIDTLMPFPPALSEALTLPINDVANNGLTHLAAAIKAVAPESATSALENLTPAGFTIFAPLDAAFTPEAYAQINNSAIAAKVLGNHYATNYTLFSAAWSGTGSFDNFNVASGERLQVVYNGTGDYVILGGQTAKIVASDIVLENGVMHVIDRILLTSATAAGGAPGTLAGSATGTGGKPAASTGNTTANGQLAGATSGAGRAVVNGGFVAGCLAIVASVLIAL